MAFFQLVSICVLSGIQKVSNGSQNKNKSKKPWIYQF